MEVIYTPRAFQELQYWKKTGNTTVQNKIDNLLVAIKENPYEGIGKPEPLKHKLSGAWSRRINKEDRLVYEMKEHNDIITLIIFSLKGHY